MPTAIEYEFVYEGRGTDEVTGKSWNVDRITRRVRISVGKAPTAYNCIYANLVAGFRAANEQVKEKMSDMDIAIAAFHETPMYLEGLTYFSVKEVK